MVLLYSRVIYLNHILTV